METSWVAQQKALRRKLAFGLLRLFSGMNSSVRFGEIAQTILSHWPVKPLPAKPAAGFCYLTIGGRAHWLMLRESLLSLHRCWKALPDLAVVSDGSWTAEEFTEVFALWPKPLTILTRSEICSAAREADLPELAEYGERSPYGLKLASIVTQAQRVPLLFVDADILWFADPAVLLGDPLSWSSPRGVREDTCYQRRDMALRHCPAVMQPPFVNGGILAVRGEFLPPELLRTMAREALADPEDGTFEQTIIATAVKLGNGLFPEKLSLVEFDDVNKFFHRNMVKEGYHSRHYVNWMRHLLYRDALSLRLKNG
jgi:hypothetical protein